MSGTIPLSMTQQFDVYGNPLSGGALYIMQAGTVATPQNPYQDAGLTIVMPNPIILDAAGRVPQFFLADGYIKIRLTDVNGIVQLASDGILVIGPSAGGGGGGTIDPTTIMATGDIKCRYDTAVIAGFVRANGRTIGPAASGASELADSTANALFQFLWNKDTSLVVLPSRGATSAADWAAGNKTIALPDWRGYALAGMDGMGSTTTGRLTSSFFGLSLPVGEPPTANTSPIVLGAVGGGEAVTLTKAQIPALAISGSGTANVNPSGNAGLFAPTSTGPWTLTSFGGAGTSSIPITSGTIGYANNFSGTASVTGTTTDAGGGAHRTIGPRKLLTIYMKL